MRYVVARYNQKQRDEAYRIYVTDSLYYMKRNEVLGIRFFDLIDKKKVIDNRSGDEIALDIISRAGLQYEGSE